MRWGMKTPMSRFRASSQHQAEDVPVLNGSLGLWHVGCTLLLSGCFYVQPVWKPPANRLPEIESVQPPPGILMFNNDTERITVIARDPDGDALQLFWTPPPLAVTSENPGPPPTDGVYVSRLDITYTEDIEGGEIVLTVLDSADAVDLTWIVEGL